MKGIINGISKLSGLKNNGWKRTSYFFILLLAIFSSLHIQAQDFPLEYKPDSSFLNQLFGHKEKKFKITPLPYIGYLPETRILGGAALLLTGRLSKDSTLPFSYSELTFTYTQNHQAILENDIFAYIGHHYVLKGLFGYEKYPDRYWGIGPKTPSGAEERYDSERVFANMAFLRKIKGRLYAGIKYRLVAMYHMQHLSGTYSLTKEEYRGSVSNGIGPALIYDTRDNILTPSRGIYLSFLNPHFGKLTASSHTFSSVEIDVRKFVRLNSKQVLAFQMTGNFVTGHPPFGMYAFLGSDMDMRGYYRGRFRDRDYTSIQAEYRRYLFWRIGMAAFAGIGNVNSNIGDLLTNAPKYSFGGGLRLKINRKENINLRMDYAFGNAPNSGLYIFLSEAF
jgi:hypothetical protein